MEVKLTSISFYINYFKLQVYMIIFKDFLNSFGVLVGNLVGEIGYK